MTTINAQTIINEVMAAHAVAPSINDDAPSTMVTFRTSEKGLHRICNRKENLQRFADMVRKNAAAFGGGLVREAKQRPAISWPANLLSLFKQSIEDHDYRAALDIGDKLGALFFVDNKGHAQMQVAPVPCDFEPRLSSVCNEDGTYAVIFPQNMTILSGASVRAKRSRAAQIGNVQEAITARTNFNLSDALDKQSYSPVDQVATRAQWILEHGLDAEVIETRIVAHESESIEQQAAQDVAHVVAQAVATIAISEAMAPSEAPISSIAGQKHLCNRAGRIASLKMMNDQIRKIDASEAWHESNIENESDLDALQDRISQCLIDLQRSSELVTCEAGESEASAPTAGRTSWAPAPQYVPPSLSQIKPGAPVPPAYRGGMDDTDPPSDGNAEPTSRPVESTEEPTPGVAVTSQNKDHLMALINRKEDERAMMNGAKSDDERKARALIVAQIEKEIQWEYAFLGMTKSAGLAQIDDDALLADIAAPMPPVAALTPPVAISTDYASDIPISLAVSAYNGVSMSPERRGASAKSEYADSMAADYEKLHAQAIKGGTLDLLPEVFARYRARQSSAYKAYLASSSRCVSSFIAGPANFPVARMQKRNDIAHKRLNEYLDGGKMALQSAIRQLRPDLRAIMSGDADAIDRLTIEIEAAERLQSQMKACNKAIRATEKMDEAHKVAALMEIGYSENQAIDILHPAYKGRGVGFPSYRLTNNQANIRRMRARLEQITAAKARPVESVECANGVTLEDDAPANRVRLFFPGKPAEAIRDELKASGFRWAPSVGAWQAYRNYGTLATARRMAGEPIEAEESTVDAVEVEEVAPPPAVESQPVAPVVVSKPNSEGERIRAAADKMRDQFPAIAAKYDDLATSHDLKDEREAQQVQNVPETPQGQQVIGKSGKWSAYLYTWHDGKPWMTFEATSGAYECNGYATASERMKALQALARAADAPTDTPPGGGLPCTDPVAAPEPVASVAPTPTVAVSSASPTPRVAVRRNFIPDNGQHIVDDAFEAWTFPWKDRFSFVMYLGKSAKPWKMFSYSTEAKRDDGFNRYATDARAIALSKADRKAQSKAQADKPHGLQVGDVVRSSWGYEQTNVNHYQIVKVIGKRTVEVRALAVHEEATGGMTGRVAPVHGEFVGEVMRRTVDARGDVNMLSASYGRASKIEPLAIVHGVRCYAASGYSSHA